MTTAREYLERVRSAIHYEECLRARLTEEQARLDGLSGIDYAAMSIPRSPNAGDGGMLHRVDRYTIICERVEKQSAFTSLLIDQSMQMFDDMRDAGCPSDYIDELEMYYIWDMTTKAIAHAVHRSESRIRQRRCEVLALADDFVPKDAA